MDDYKPAYIGADWTVIRKEPSTEATHTNPTRSGHPQFYRFLDEIADLHERKNADYAGTGDFGRIKNPPLGNFERVGKILGLYPGLDPSDRRVVALMYMLKQLDAVLFSLSNKHELRVEGRRPRLRDMAVYSILLEVMEWDLGVGK